MFFSTAEERGNIHYEEKRRIAKYAASLVREGDTLFLDASSTVYAIMEFLTVPVTMITNNLSICMELKDKEYIAEKFYDDDRERGAAYNQYLLCG